MTADKSSEAMGPAGAGSPLRYDRERRKETYESGFFGDGTC